MQKIHHDSDILIEQELPTPSNSVLVSFKNLNVAANRFQSDLNLYVTSDSGKPLNKALISIDSASLTAVSDQSGKVCIKSLPAGRYHLDIICPGFIAKSILIYIDESGSQEIFAQLTSNIG
ncbi:MAG: carboxypeptidase-like regulatory domain-containing protein [Daejeonella sp.]|nr:carboxypeptidase-like regulatory domain-containing protein [Daejeonella sp.]